MKLAECWNKHTRRLPPLKVGHHVRIQNQTGNHSTKWDKTGVVVEVRQYDQYVVRMDGSGRMTLRNRKFLTITDDLPFTARSTPSTSSPKAATTGRTCQGDPNTDQDPSHNKPTLSYHKQPTLEARAPTPTDTPPTIDPPPPPAHTATPTIPTAPPAPTQRKPPLALWRLMDFNSPGLKET